MTGPVVRSFNDYPSIASHSEGRVLYRPENRVRSEYPNEKRERKCTPSFHNPSALHQFTFCAVTLRRHACVAEREDMPRPRR